MDPVVYHYPQCSTCRRALGWLLSQKVAVKLVDVVQRPPSVATLKRAHELAQVPVRKLFNVSGKSYRDGNFATKLATMTDDEAFAALAQDGKLIKRPLVLGVDFALIGFDEGAWRDALVG